MNRPRNNFSIPKGDVALYAVLSRRDVADLAPDLGPFNSRYQRFLRRFCLPRSNGAGGNSFAWLVKIPETVLDRAPQSAREALRPLFTDDREALARDHPWIDKSSGDRAEIDRTLGSELGSDGDWRTWETTE